MTPVRPICLCHAVDISIRKLPINLAYSGFKEGGLTG